MEHLDIGGNLYYLFLIALIGFSIVYLIKLYYYSYSYEVKTKIKYVNPNSKFEKYV